jgi:tripartite-type tricarboxylate transporter receptor subunit TctC
MYRTLSLVLTLIVGFTSYAHAQADWPTAKPVTVIVPSSPGGGTDAYGRILAQALTEQLKQTFVVENKPGASGAIGAALAAQAAPDGYTLLVASNSSLGINPALYKTLQYDVWRDFAPVTRGVIAPMVVVAHPDAKVKHARRAGRPRQEGTRRPLLRQRRHRQPALHRHAHARGGERRALQPRAL